MIKRRKIIPVFIGALVASASSHADMVPLSPRDAAICRQSPHAHSLTNLPPASPSTSFADSSRIFGLDAFPVGSLPPSDRDAGLTSETKLARILTDRQNSLTLCLYALLGLGLCRSASCVRKFHLSCIPDWYDAGGPYQVGHRLAISPDCLPSAPAFCFGPPGWVEATSDALPQLRRRGHDAGCGLAASSARFG